jgi:hypothetical protein
MSFDLRTVIRDGRTGATVKSQPYLAKLEKGKGTIFERPIGSGQYFDEQGNTVNAAGKPQVETVEVKAAEVVETKTESKLTISTAEIKEAKK